MDQISKMGLILKAEVQTKRLKLKFFVNLTSEAQKWPQKVVVIVHNPDILTATSMLS